MRYFRIISNFIFDKLGSSNRKVISCINILYFYDIVIVRVGGDCY